MKDIIVSQCILNIAKINKDKGYIIIETLFPIVTEESVVYAAATHSKCNYFVRMKINAIDFLKLNSKIKLNEDLSIEYRESKYLNSNNEEVVTKWADEKQFDFSKFVDSDFPIRKRTNSSI